MAMNEKQLLEKWESIPSSLNIQNIEDPYIKLNTAKMMENQMDDEAYNSLEENFTQSLAMSNLNYGSQDHGDGNFGGGNTSNGVFRTISLAMQRRVFPQLFAHKAVGVQTMNGPVGLAYAMRFKYRNANGIVGPEAGWLNVPEYAGFTGNTRAGSAAVPGSAASDADIATYLGKISGEDVYAAEKWGVPGQTPGGMEGATQFPYGPDAGYPAAAGSAGAAYPEVTFALESKSIKAETRKIACSFSLENAMDVKKMHNIEIEKELVQKISFELLAGLDRQLIFSMRSLTTTANKNVFTFSFSASGTADFKADGRWSQEKMANLVNTIDFVSSTIGQKTQLGDGNFMVVSNKVASLLKSTNAQKWFTTSVAEVKNSRQLTEVGTINGTIKVFRDTFQRDNDILIGFKGNGVDETGVIYCPYVSGISNRAIDPFTFAPRIGIMNRYAVVDNLLDPQNYYARIIVKDLDVVGYGDSGVTGNFNPAEVVTKVATAPRF
jgi:hypothetical protein